MRRGAPAAVLAPASTNEAAQPAAATDTAGAVTNLRPPYPDRSASPAPPNVEPATFMVGSGTNGLRLNFHNAPLNLVLDYLSDAAGFVINKETDVRGTVDIQGKDLDEGRGGRVAQLGCCKKNGCAVVRNGRILTIVAQDEVHHKDTPVVVGNNPAEASGGDEVVTQIIPVRYANVTQLVPNLQQLLPTSATLSANESANSLILVATKTDIQRILKIVNALDTSIASVSSIRVIPLRYRRRQGHSDVDHHPPYAAAVG